MDEGVRLPTDLLGFLEGEISNPELYVFKAYDVRRALSFTIIISPMRYINDAS
jgi:hypothetical protein